ncbi:MAG: MBL fold metallo-hydrolase, partial [Gemmatimonadetes bacterium]|nr:MBL fold metallo-hydrolase [Gemmatimonadota bacterium]
GVPMIGCDCAVCSSPDPRNRRLRPSVYLETDDACLLVDPTPDFRTQALRAGLRRVDAVLLTHSHAD